MYCKKCGEKLVLKYCENEGLVPYCPHCEKFRFPIFSTAVSMVVTNEKKDKILLAKHTGSSDYLLFAGYIKKGESAEKTVVRELEEELGISILQESFMSSKWHDAREVLMLNFLVVVNENQPITLKEDEVQEARWCSLEEALSLIKKESTAEYFLQKAVHSFS